MRLMKRCWLTSLLFVLLGLGCQCAGSSDRVATLTNNNVSTNVQTQSNSDSKGKTDLQNRYEDMLHAIKQESLKSRITNLSEEILSDSETEIRFWVGFGLAYPRCFILRYSSRQPRAFFLAPKTSGAKGAIHTSAEVSRVRTVLNAPASGWDEFNSFLKGEGIDYPLQLLGEENQIVDPDAESIVVEIKSGTRYSMVSYSLDPDTDDGRKVVEVCRRIEREFNVWMGCGGSTSKS